MPWAVLLALTLVVPVVLLGLVAYGLTDPDRAVASVGVAALVVVLASLAVALVVSRAQLAAATREQAAREVRQVMPDALVLADVEGLITGFNPAAEKIFGWSAREIVGRPVAELMPERFRDAHRAGLRRYGETREAHIIGSTLELVGQRKDGAEFPLELSLASWEDEGGRPAYAAVIRDITERRVAEDALRRSEEELRTAWTQADAANRAKSEFLANMSHEIRTPMNGIIGVAELLADTPLDARQREYLHLVSTSADTLLRLLEDILDLSKIEARKLDLESVTFSLRDLVGDTLQALAVRATQKGLELTYHIGADVPDAVVGDPGRLRQVLVNLVGNALKFTDEGEVFVDVRSEGTGEGEVELHFAVRDTGPGITPELQRRIFQAFVRGEEAIARRTGGTGLGLAISSQLVELMGGRITLDSAPGKGSTFHFTVRVGVAEGPAQESTCAPGDIAGVRALVVDDNATNRLVFEELLRSWKMRPRVASGGVEGLAELRRGLRDGDPYRLVLLDVMMPDLDGLEVARRIAADPDLAATRIVVLSSAGGALPALDGAPVSRTLTKPVKASALLETLCQVLGGIEVERVLPQGEQRAREPLRVLVAEDNPVNQVVTVRLLERVGHEVVVAADGQDAVEVLFGQGPFDVVLMDVEMPRMSGIEATAEIRRREAGTGGKTPIVGLTAHALKGDRERFLEAGMDAYLAKPVRPEALYAVIEDAVQQARLARTP